MNYMKVLTEADHKLSTLLENKKSPWLLQVGTLYLKETNNKVWLIMIKYTHTKYKLYTVYEKRNLKAQKLDSLNYY